ncbi:uncharacterized protein LOC143299243 isoform X2 [Babylonia areolata]|uniref:uncharacterized protein LOC143299243 isoform X2 n=1 Tax=Babylonia areolata TaxID=304850 RepID=UPI003FD5C8CB
MSETAEVLAEGGGAPLPPKRPTIIRPAQDGRGPVPARPAPTRPAPPPPGARPPPGVPTPAAGVAGPVPAPVPQRPSGAAPTPVSHKPPDRLAKSSSTKSKSQGSVRKRPEITIVDARPMSQAGFREMKASEPSPPKPAGSSAKEEEAVTLPRSNGGAPPIPGRPPPTPTTAAHSTPPPNHSPPPIPSSRPGPPPGRPPPFPDKPTPPSLNDDQQETPSAGPPPMKPSRPTILRPARPKSTIIPGEQPFVNSSPSPPPPLPKRSPIVGEGPSAQGDLMDFLPPPKPARSSQHGEEELPEPEKEAEDGGGKGEGQGHVAPKKPTRVSIIRPPPRRPKSMIDTAPENKDEPQEGTSHLPPRPKPPLPASRPVAMVAAVPKSSSEGESWQPTEEEQTRTAGPPVPAARTRTSPRECPQEELAPGASPVPSPRSVPQSDVSEQSTKPAPHMDVDKILTAPSRPKPPLPVARPHGGPPTVPSPGGSPRLSQKVVPSKPPPPHVVDTVSGSQGPTTRGDGLPPPLVPSRPPVAMGTVPVAEGCLYAVSEPLETTDTFTKMPSPSNSQPSRPPPPVPKSRPKSSAHSSPMLGRPLPSVPPQSPPTASPPLAPSHCYEDVDSVKAQARTSVSAISMDLPAQQHSTSSPTETVEAGNESQKEDDISALYAKVNKPVEAANESQKEDDISALYAKVNKPSKPKNSQNSHPDTGSSDSAALNPFGVSLKHIAPEDSPESEAPPIPPKLGSDHTDVSPPLLSPKPKPSISAKPQVAGKPKSPRSEENPVELSEASTTKAESSEQSGPPAKPQVADKPKSPRSEETPANSLEASSTKTESSEQSKPPVAAKRPTIIRPSKPAPKTESSASSAEDASEVQLREKGSEKESVPCPQSEPPGDGENKTSVLGRPAPPKRPVTIIGLPHQRQKPPALESTKEETTAPKHQAVEDSLSGAEKSEAKEAEPDGHSTAPPPLHASPALPRPPPPRPGKPHSSPPSERSKTDLESSAPPKPPTPAPPRPAARPASEAVAPGVEEAAVTASAVARKTKDEEEEGGGAVPGRPPSPAPPRPSTRPASAMLAPSREEGGATMSSSSPKSSPPVHRKEPSPCEEEAVARRPGRPGGPPPRPMSMPPVKPPLSATTTVSPAAASGTMEPRQEKPSRPQPVRPTPPKQPQTTAPPPLPKRPGLNHPLYRYMATEPHAIAVHAYPARHPDELPFEEGDTVLLLKRVDEQWLKGKVGDKEGIFPQSFVTIIHPLHDELPPSALDDVIDTMFEDALQEKPDLLQGPRCRARFDFEGEDDADLAFEDGDVIQLIARCGDDWLRGELNRKVGIFPAAFVEIIEDLPEERGDVTMGATEKGRHEAVALFDFSGQEGELSFKAGDQICVVSRVDKQWLFGQSGGREGSFPASFVDVVPDDLPQHGPQGASHSAVSAAGSQPSQAPAAAANQQDTAGQWGTALFSFDKMQEGDLEFREGERILVVGKMGEEWLRGRLGDREGVFPSSFVKMDSGPGGESTEAAVPEDHGTGLSTHTALVMGKALFDFEGQADNELSFKVNDEIVLGSMVSEGSEWQWGELHGKKGMFPASFVEMI